MGYAKERQKPEKKQKVLDALKRKLDAVYEELATKREKAGKKQQDNICLVRIVKYYEQHRLKIMTNSKPSWRPGKCSRNHMPC